MLTRLKVSGFKNLYDVDISFGSFTCIAGENGVGKSNLFDAILFLSRLADKTLVEAARGVRDEERLSADLSDIFFKVGDSHVNEMSFEADLLIPSSGLDDLNQTATASITFVKYTLILRHRPADAERPEGLEILHESLQPVKIGDAHHHLPFDHSVAWRKSVVSGARRNVGFISTKGSEIVLHQDAGSRGKGVPTSRANTPRTVLSSINTCESPTVLLTRREFQSWRLLQLEPTALRASDSFFEDDRVAANGAHLGATLHRLARASKTSRAHGTSRQTSLPNANDEHSRINTLVANQLAKLVDDIRGVHVDIDQIRQLFTLYVTDKNGRSHPARSLSDGTLRFLALTILQNDPGARGLLCLEEPENGIHPKRIDAMLELLHDLATDCEEPVDDDNPFRQVIVNTHSPAVVGEVNADELVIASAANVVVPAEKLGCDASGSTVSGRESRRSRAVTFRWLAETWRARVNPNIAPVNRGDLGIYLNPHRLVAETVEKSRRGSKVKERPDVQLLLPFGGE